MTREKRCPTCGHITTLSEKNAAKSRENGRKGGRKINPNSKRQKRLREKQSKLELQNI